MKRRWMNRAVLLLCMFGLCLGMAYPARAAELEREEEISGGKTALKGPDIRAEEETALDSLLGDLDLTSIEEFLKAQTETGDVTFKELLETLLDGNFTDIFHKILVLLKDSIFKEMKSGGFWIRQVLILGLVGAMFANFSGIFSDSQISETGFYVTYLLMGTFLAASFLNGITITGELLERIMEFMRALLPSYFLAVSFAGGSLTSAAGYGWMLFSIGLAQWLFLSFFMPCIRIYMLLVLGGHVVREDVFSRMTELLESGIRWGLKTMTGVILGFHLLQNMVIPYADSLKNTSLQRLVSVIPGIGQGAAAVSQMVMGAGVLLKNTMGAGAVLVLVLISLVPLFKLLVLCLLYRSAAAILQPVCDKRMAACINGVGNGCFLLFTLAGTALLLFGFSLVIICLSANAAYFGG